MHPPFPPCGETSICLRRLARLDQQRAPDGVVDREPPVDEVIEQQEQQKGRGQDPESGGVQGDGEGLECQRQRPWIRVSGCRHAIFNGRAAAKERTDGENGGPPSHAVARLSAQRRLEHARQRDDQPEDVVAD